VLGDPNEMDGHRVSRSWAHLFVSFVGLDALVSSTGAPLMADDTARELPPLEERSLRE
jgi:hypothetical protein